VIRQTYWSVCDFQGDNEAERKKFAWVILVTSYVTMATKNNIADIKIVWLIIALDDLSNLSPVST
jgi:hypothetical protein